MFGYYYGYRDPRRPDPGDVFGSVIAILVVICIIAAFAFYFGAIVLLVFLGIGAVIGGAYAIFVYVKAFVNACKTLGYVHGSNGLTSALLRWWHLFKTASVDAFKSNLSVAHSALLRAGNYKLLSFKKWMWFIVAPTVLILGTAMIAFVALAQVFIMLSIIGILLTLLVFALVLVGVISLVFAAIKCFPNYKYAFPYHNPFSAANFCRGFTFYDLGNVCSGYFIALVQLIASVWRDMISFIKTCFSDAKNYALFNPVRYFLFLSPVGTLALNLLCIAVIFIVLTVVFVPLFLAQLVWLPISKLVK